MISADTMMVKKREKKSIVFCAMTTQLQFEDSKVNFNSAPLSHLMKFRFAAAAALQSQSVDDASVLAFE